MSSRVLLYHFFYKWNPIDKCVFLFVFHSSHLLSLVVVSVWYFVKPVCIYNALRFVRECASFSSSKLNRIHKFILHQVLLLPYLKLFLCCFHTTVVYRLSHCQYFVPDTLWGFYLLHFYLHTQGFVCRIIPLLPVLF